MVIEKIDVDSKMNEAEENVEGYCHSTFLHAGLSENYAIHIVHPLFIAVKNV